MEGGTYVCRWTRRDNKYVLSLDENASRFQIDLCHTSYDVSPDDRPFLMFRPVRNWREGRMGTDTLPSVRSESDWG